MKKQSFYYGCLILTFVLWGFLYVAAKYALKGFPPITLVMLRYLIAAAVLGAALYKKGIGKIKKVDGKYFWLIGVLGYFFSIVLQMYGTKLLDASLASLIYALNPVITPILARIILKERLSGLRIFGIGVSLFGVYVILGTGTGSWSVPGAAAILAATFFWALSSIVTRSISEKYDPLEITFWGMATALVFNIPAAAAELSGASVQLSVSAVAALLYLALFGTVAAYTLWNVSLKGLSAGTCAMLFPIQPLSSAFFGVLLLHEPLSVSFLAGAGIVSAGILLAAKSDFPAQ